MIPSPKYDGAPLLIGVVHLLPLPGAPRRGPGLDAVRARALHDVRALLEGGADGVIVENLGDAPFAADQVPPVTIAAMTRIVDAVREAAPQLALGVNVLRNDGLAALGIAHACGADFIRINVLTGVMATDQGLIEGRARDVAMQRRLLDADVGVVADVLVKHATPLGPLDLGDVAHDTFHRGGADALVVSGTGTGRPTDPEDVRTVRAAVPEAPLWLGSGLTPESAASLRTHLDAAIVGTWLHTDGDLSAPLDARRVATLKAALIDG